MSCVGRQDTATWGEEMKEGEQIQMVTGEERPV